MTRHLTPPPLLFGTYLPPQVKRGDWIDDAIYGLTEVGGRSHRGTMDWPRRKKSGAPSLIVTDELARAVRQESVSAICHAFGVGPVTVWAWRVALGVDRITDGTRALLQDHTGVPPEAAARGRQRAASEAARAKMAATKTGVPAPASVRAGLLRAAKGPKPHGWGKRANKWMIDAK